MFYIYKVFVWPPIIETLTRPTLEPLNLYTASGESINKL